MSTSPAKPTDKPGHHVDSQILLKGQSQVVIKHGEMLYRLAVTRENKLILTK